MHATGASPLNAAAFAFRAHPCATRSQRPNRSFRVADQIQRDLAELIARS
jgi:hypothetical protein